MKTTLKWLLWLWICGVIWGAFKYAPLAEGFLGESSRILFFHVPMAWTAFIAFFAAGVWSLRYLFFGRALRHDHAAYAAIELGLVFCILATLSGALWARIMWGAYWNWDPRQVWITVAILFYGAYLVLRSAVPDLERRRRLAAAYAVLGLVVAPFLFFILPRMTGFTLHPEPVINQTGKVEMEARMGQVLAAGSFAFMALFFWLHNLRCRLAALAESRFEAGLPSPAPAVAAPQEIRDAR